MVILPIVGIFIDQLSDELHIRNQLGEDLSAPGCIMIFDGKKLEFVDNGHLKARLHSSGKPVIYFIIQPGTDQVNGEGNCRLAV